MRYLILRLDAPLLPFGGETIDRYGVIRLFPASSMLVGLLANALGMDRTEARALQRFQERVVVSSRVEGEPVLVREFQTARLGAKDHGWTSRGHAEGRSGGTATYDSPHIRLRDYWAEITVTVALRLEPEDESPTLEGVAAALHRPDRPLFIGRKPCLPSRPILDPEPFVEAKSGYHALEQAGVGGRAGRCFVPRGGARSSLQWPAGEGPDEGRAEGICDERDWVSGVHAGERRVRCQHIVYGPAR